MDPAPDDPAPDDSAHEDESLARRFQQAISSVDEALIARGRWLSARCLVQIGSRAVLLAIEHGVPRVVADIPPLCSWDFSVKASGRAWDALWQTTPAPGWHDLFALSKRGELQLEGNLQPLMANLQYMKDLLALPRRGAPR